MKFSKSLLLLSALVCCSCDMGRFYAGKRMGHGHVEHSFKQTAKNTTDRPDTLCRQVFAEEETTTVMEEKGEFPFIASSLPHHRTNGKTATPNHNKAIKKTGHLHNKIIAGANVSRKTNKGDSIWAILLYALAIGVELGILVFLISWIFKPAAAAFVTALWVVAGAFIFVLLVGLFLGPGMGDHGEPAGTNTSAY